MVSNIAHALNMIQYYFKPCSTSLNHDWAENYQFWKKTLWNRLDVYLKLQRAGYYAQLSPAELDQVRQRIKRFIAYLTELKE
jgi:hypothetical protein